jgi:dephospho-CoA kinase
MLNYTEFKTAVPLEEKLIVYSGGKKYGQIVFLAGGAGSGKGFASDKFMQKDLFKVRDIDEWKKAFLKLSSETRKYPELRGLNLRSPDDVFKLHMFVKKLGIKSRSLQLLLKDVRPDRLPNIMFDITFAEMEDIDEVIPLLLKAGYQPRDIHISWVLTNYHIAVKQNKERDRVVPDDIMIKTHTGAATSMFEVIYGNLPRGVDGQVNIILNNKNNTIKFADSPHADPDKKIENVLDFEYFRIKHEGKRMETTEKSLDKVMTWVKSNIPRNVNLIDLFKSKEGIIVKDPTQAIRDTEKTSEFGIGRRIKQRLSA